MTPLWVWLVGLLGILILNVASPRPSTVQADVWHQMALARASLQAGHLLNMDVFSYAPTVVPSVQHEWAAGFLALFCASHGGGFSLALLNMLLSLMTVLLLAAILYRNAVPAVLALAGLFLSRQIGVSSYIPLTAQVYSCFFFSALLFCLHVDGRGSRVWIPVWLFLFPAWVNLHGGFALAFLAVGALALERMLSRRPYLHLLWVLLAMALLVLLNPFGLDLIQFLAHALLLKRPFISEWDPFWLFHQPNNVHAAFLVSIVALFLIARKARSVLPELEGKVLVVLLLLLCLRTPKLLPFYTAAWLVTVPVAAAKTPFGAEFASLWRREQGTVLVAVVTTTACGFVLLWLSTPWRVLVPGSPTHGVFGTVYPVGPVQYLQAAGFRGNVMTPFMTGAYVSWKLAPAVKVGCDSRYEVAYPVEYVDAVVRLYQRASHEDWRRVIEKSATDLILVERGAALASRLQRQPGWHLCYSDDAFLLYGRNTVNLPAVDRSGQRIWGTFP